MIEVYCTNVIIATLILVFFQGVVVRPHVRRIASFTLFDVCVNTSYDIENVL